MALPASRKTNFTSSWIFPPPIDEIWLEAWNASLPVPNSTTTVQQNATTSPFDILTAAAQNVTAAKVFYGQGGSGQGVGNMYTAPGVGDVIQPKWGPVDGNEFKSPVSMYCIICNQGEGIYGGIWAACGNYTDTSHTSQFFNTTETPLVSSNTPMTMPSLSSTLQLPGEAVGLCYFLIYQDRYTDYSAPFTVTESPHMPHYRFNSTMPTGIPDSSIPTGTSASLIDPTGTGSKGLSKGAIAGIVLGGLIAIAFLLGAALFFLKRKQKQRQGSQSNSAHGGENELQHVQPGGVERRMSHDVDGLPPPAYHEVIAAKSERYD